MPRFFALFLAVLCILSLGSSAQDFELLQPGDLGYKHTEERHKAYQEFFRGGRCNCNTGQCRATIARPNKESPSGIDMKIDGKWYPIPAEVLHRKAIPEELKRDEAHVCAFRPVTPRTTPPIECAIYNDGV